MNYLNRMKSCFESSEKKNKSWILHDNCQFIHTKSNSNCKIKLNEKKKRNSWDTGEEYNYIEQQ